MLLYDNIVNITNLEEFDNFVKENDYIVVDCYAHWCGPCKFIAPYFAGLSVNSNYCKVKFVKVDVDNAMEIAQKLQIAVMPSFYFFRYGVLVDHFTGASCDDLCLALDKLISA